MQSYLTAKKRDDVSTSHLYNAFRSYALKAGRATELLASIRCYAAIYQSFDTMPEGSREARFFHRVRTMDILSAFPFVLELFATQGAHGPEVLGALLDVESFLVRRMICGLNTRGYNRLFVDLLGTMEGDGTIGARVRKFLLVGDKGSNRWPDDEEFKAAWLDRPIFQLLLQPRIRLVLEALEQELRMSKTEDVRFNVALQIEHFLPQNWAEHWPLPEPLPAGADAQEAKGRRGVLLHTFGNLGLLTKSLNPSVSNGPWETKSAEILEHSALNLNRKACDLPVWDEAAIRRRGEALFTAVCRVWSHPGKNAAPVSVTAA